MVSYIYKKKKRQTDDVQQKLWYADYVDDLALLADTSAQAESLLHGLKQAAGGISVYVNANKTDNMCFKQKGAILTRRGKPMKLVDQFPYLSSNISSTERDVNISPVKAWFAIDRSLIIWMSNNADRIQWYFFPAVAISMLLYGCTPWIVTKLN